MRMTATLALAAAILVAAAPAAAQNTAAVNNTTDMTSANTVNTTSATTANDVGNVAMPPAATPETETTRSETNTAVDVGYGPPTQPKEKRGFPWGVIGLLGLLGFLPRARRRG